MTIALVTNAAKLPMMPERTACIPSDWTSFASFALGTANWMGIFVVWPVKAGVDTDFIFLGAVYAVGRAWYAFLLPMPRLNCAGSTRRAGS